MPGCPWLERAYRGFYRTFSRSKPCPAFMGERGAGTFRSAGRSLPGLGHHVRVSQIAEGASEARQIRDRDRDS
jgi:hypothetical protein